MNESQSLDFSSSDELAGFRLRRLEVYNWGTFHDRSWALDLNGRNALLTGDIGSGKSTLVDAVTTLLVPAQRIAYNKAAGADARERSLRSYVQGYYKLERNDDGQVSRPVALRDHNSYSVLLGVFYNEGYDQAVTLGQVFWCKDNRAQPARFYLVADDVLSIGEHFSGFGGDINGLRKRLKTRQRTEVFDSFPPYAAAFRRRFGIENEQALKLFLQTVSMKSVGNLTDFVREHMLEAFDVEPRIEALIHHFEDLNRAHEAVLKAKDQVNRLTPLVGDCDRHQELSVQCVEWRTCRDALNAWFADLKAGLLDKRLENLAQDQQRIVIRIESLDETRGEQLVQRDSIKQAIAQNGGDRLERIDADVRAKTETRRRRQERAQRYRELAQALDLRSAGDSETFIANHTRLAELQERQRNIDDELQNRQTEAGAKLINLRREHGEIEGELVSLRKRLSSIDERQISIRRRLCEDLSLAEEDMPFSGELIQVRAEESAWEGALERLLHNFALSLLVPDEHYREVADWVNRNHLNARLVYYRVRPETARDRPVLHPDSLVRKLSIKPDSGFYAWLENMLSRRFDYACCDDLETFRRERQAITRTGQIKSKGERHEKDDRHRIDDRSRYVLGWSNEGKINALERKSAQLEASIQVKADEVADAQREQGQVKERLHQLAQISEYRDFIELNWQPLAVEIANLEQERQVLEASSNKLQTLTRQLQELESLLRQSELVLREQNEARIRNEEKQAQARMQLEDCQGRIATLEASEREPPFHQLQVMQTDAIGERQLTVESCDNREKEMRDWLQKKIDSHDRKIRDLSERIVKTMQSYRNDYPLETDEVDASLDAADEYRTMLEQLGRDDLPAFEHRFKELLNENTIREVANFQSQLNRERQTIRERIERINESLGQIDYNPNRYILLETQANSDADIRDFQQELRACTEGALTGSEDSQYSEAKFLQVKSIIERFRGREGSSELDKRWTGKVTDVRYWFTFSASERWREDDREHEHYTDSGGKSGGQKEKLAYTVLAASLAYQFGLEWGEIKSRSFRFVVIDEAFGRGSDDSTRYALELFKRLNLQLLIVTPLQKIHIIEPYVSGVGFVHNEDGRESKLRNLTISEYQAEKEARR
ncbi:MAG: ATP-dependent exonuclease SbcCD, C subunit-like protein [Gammaproteobacteria bacterium]|nr:ATP-dependent exonuclease SbcCD, C subunit-like protein [Gammaproteobacteria bacterium]